MGREYFIRMMFPEGRILVGINVACRAIPSSSRVGRTLEFCREEAPGLKIVIEQGERWYVSQLEGRFGSEHAARLNQVIRRF